MELFKENQINLYIKCNLKIVNLDIRHIVRLEHRYLQTFQQTQQQAIIH